MKLVIKGTAYEEEEATSTRAERSRNDKKMQSAESGIFGAHGSDKDSFVQDVWSADQTPSSLSDVNADSVK